MLHSLLPQSNEQKQSATEQENKAIGRSKYQGRPFTMTGFTLGSWKIPILTTNVIQTTTEDMYQQVLEQDMLVWRKGKITLTLSPKSAEKT